MSPLSIMLRICRVLFRYCLPLSYSVPLRYTWYIVHVLRQRNPFIGYGWSYVIITVSFFVLSNWTRQMQSASPVYNGWGCSRLLSPTSYACVPQHVARIAVRASVTSTPLVNLSEHQSICYSILTIIYMYRVFNSLLTYICTNIYIYKHRNIISMFFVGKLYL